MTLSKRKADHDLSESEPKSKRFKGDQQSHDSNSDHEEQEEGVKWNSLEHNGVTFFPGYEPHGVKLLFKVSF
jgi:hypothetical protein